MFWLSRFQPNLLCITGFTQRFNGETIVVEPTGGQTLHKLAQVIQPTQLTICAAILFSDVLCPIGRRCQHPRLVQPLERLFHDSELDFIWCNIVGPEQLRIERALAANDLHEVEDAFHESPAGAV